jgi:hypothetical protein
MRELVLELPEACLASIDQNSNGLHVPVISLPSSHYVMFTKLAVLLLNVQLLLFCTDPFQAAVLERELMTSSACGICA